MQTKIRYKGGKTRKLSISLFVIALIFLVAGVSFAFFNANLKGNYDHELVVGQNLIFRYNEIGEGIKLTNDDELTDEEGINSSNYFEFEVSLQSEVETSIGYYIYITKDASSTLSDNNIKLYLTDQEDNTISNIRTISSLAKHETEENSYYLYSKIITSNNNITITDKYRLRVWLDPVAATITESDGTHTLEMTPKTYKFKVSVATTENIIDTSNANTPVLASNMIPVYYDEVNEVWKKADSSNSNSSYKWYDYNSKMWANAVTVSETNRDTYINASVGTEISMDDINTMWVWIPRFSAINGDLTCSTIENPTVEENPNCYDIDISDEDKTKLINYCIENWGETETECTSYINDILSSGYDIDGDTMEDWLNWYEEDTGDTSIVVDYTFNQAKMATKFNGGTQSDPGAFDITFVDNKTSAHDAFTFGTQNLNGFWVGKFETSHNTLSSSTTYNNLGCTSDTCSNANGIIIKPNVQSLGYNNVSNFYYGILSMTQTGNSFGFDKTTDTTLDTHMMKNNEWGAVA
ncbi:MAG: hypothetical protein ACI4P7_04095, partial [Bacilli bacterium]